MPWSVHEASEIPLRILDDESKNSLARAEKKNKKKKKPCMERNQAIPVAKKKALSISMLERFFRSARTATHKTPLGNAHARA